MSELLRETEQASARLPDAVLPEDQERFLLHSLAKLWSSSHEMLVTGLSQKECARALMGCFKVFAEQVGWVITPPSLSSPHTGSI